MAAHEATPRPRARPGRVSAAASFQRWPGFNSVRQRLNCCVRATDFQSPAPIGNWRLLQDFDTAEACKTFRDDRIQMLEKCPGPQPCPATPELKRFNLDMIQQSRCVSRDDLLKEVR
jgi:hypothetical protein